MGVRICLRARLPELCRSHAEALMALLRNDAANGIGTFRILKEIPPLTFRPEAGYAAKESLGNVMWGRGRGGAVFIRSSRGFGGHFIRISWLPQIVFCGIV
jgi:hypothetical protein